MASSSSAGMSAVAAKHTDESNQQARARYKRSALNLVKERRKRIEENPTTINDLDRSSRTLLHSATYHGDYETVQWLMEQKGVELNIRNKYGCSALDIAIECGHDGIAEMLINDERVNILAYDSDYIYIKTPPLCRAIWHHNEKIAALLAKRREIDINAVVEILHNGITKSARLLDYFLLFADHSYSMRQNSLQLLLSLGAKIMSQTIRMAVEDKDIRALNFIFEHKDFFERADTFSSVQDELLELASKKMEKERETLEENKAKFDSFNERVKIDFSVRVHNTPEFEEYFLLYSDVRDSTSRYEKWQKVQALIAHQKNEKDCETQTRVTSPHSRLMFLGGARAASSILTPDSTASSSTGSAPSPGASKQQS